MIPAPQPLHALVVQCFQQGDAWLWEQLIAQLQPLIARTVYRVASSWGAVNPQDVDDVTQETFAKIATGADTLLRAQFENELAAIGYFKVLAANSARDYFRSKYADKRGVSQTLAVADRLEEIASAPVSDSDRAIFLSEIEKLLPPDLRDRSVFWLYYRQGFTAKEIADVPGIGLTVKGVESVIHRLTAVVRKAVSGKFLKGNSNAGAF